jgi:hypothetical protein
LRDEGAKYVPCGGEERLRGEARSPPPPRLTVLRTAAIYLVAHCGNLRIDLGHDRLVRGAVAWRPPQLVASVKSAPSHAFELPRLGERSYIRLGSARGAGRRA